MHSNVARLTAENLFQFLSDTFRLFLTVSYISLTSYMSIFCSFSCTFFVHVKMSLSGPCTVKYHFYIRLLGKCWTEGRKTRHAGKASGLKLSNDEYRCNYMYEAWPRLSPVELLPTHPHDDRGNRRCSDRKKKGKYVNGTPIKILNESWARIRWSWTFTNEMTPPSPIK